MQVQYLKSAIFDQYLTLFWKWYKTDICEIKTTCNSVMI